METPSSAATRRITRSQAYVAANKSDSFSTNQNVEYLREESAKSRQRTMKHQDRSALIDITNDSAIVGLSMGKLGTLSSLMSKKGKRDSTPGSGEAILRGQVKTLLQKVEEEAEISKLSSVPKRPLLNLQGHCYNNSPMGLILVAPTPANTPQIISNPSAILSGNSIGLTSILDKDICIPQGEEEMDLMVTRSLMVEFSEKSEDSHSSKCSSVVTCQVGESSKSSIEDDDSSIWSIKVNANIKIDDQETDDEEIEGEVINDDVYSEETEEETGDGGDDAGLFDELCKAINKINVHGDGQTIFCGKHTKFVYDIDDELEGEEMVCGSTSSTNSAGALKLQGWPSPKGKHVRFPEAF